VVCRHAQAAKARRKVQEADNRKLQNRIKHSKPGSITVKPERKKKIIAQVE
jgi:WD repeat and SOF domain-containing protein 1